MGDTLRRSRQAAVPQAEVEALAGDAKKRRCFALAAPGLKQGCLQQARLEAFHGAVIALGNQRRFLFLREAHVQADDKSLRDIAQLPYISRPTIVAQLAA